VAERESRWRHRSSTRTSRLSLTLLVIAATLAVPAISYGAEAPDLTLRLRVTDGAGRGLARAAVVVGVRWTREAQWTKHGGRIDGRIVRVGLDGNADISIRLTPDQRAAAALNGDWVSLSIVALDAQGNPMAFSTENRYLGSKADQLAKDESRSARRLFMRAPNESTVSAVSWVASTQTELTTTLADCPWYYWEDYQYSNRYTQVGELHVDHDVTTAKFTYGETADSSIDVMAKATSLPWSASGSIHIGNSFATSVSASAGGQTNYHWALRTQFRYVNMRLYKDCVGGPYHYWTGSEEIGPVQWLQGGMTLANTVTQPARNPAYSQSYGKGTSWSRSQNKFAKVSGAVTWLGASIGAQSGASSEVRIEYVFGFGRTTHYLYGNNALPAQSGKVYQDTN
jgi:hypothetical protein